MDRSVRRYGGQPAGVKRAQRVPVRAVAHCGADGVRAVSPLSLGHTRKVVSSRRLLRLLLQSIAGTKNSPRSGCCESQPVTQRCIVRGLQSHSATCAKMAQQTHAHTCSACGRVLEGARPSEGAAALSCCFKRMHIEHVRTLQTPAVETTQGPTAEALTQRETVPWSWRRGRGRWCGEGWGSGRRRRGVRWRGRRLRR